MKIYDTVCIVVFFGGPVGKVPAYCSKGHRFESGSVQRSIFLTKKY